MKILITGGAGYIGSHTILELLKAGCEVVVIDNLCNSSAESLRRVEKISGKTVEFHQVDLLDPEGVGKVFADAGIDAVIHFAGLKAVGESVRIPLRYYHNNITGTLILCEAMAAAGCRHLVFSSSATVYGDPASVPIDEESPLSATNPYGRTKLYIEQILRDLHAADPTFNIALLRYFNPVGAHPSGLIGEDPNGIPNNLVPYISQVAIGRRPELSVYGRDYPTPDGTGVRDYIHVLDLALGHVRALEKLRLNPGLITYNLGTGHGYSVLEMVAAFEKASGRRIPTRIASRRPGDIATCYADPSKASTELGWKASRGIDQMCADTWRWQTLNPDGYKNKIPTNDPLDSMTPAQNTKRLASRTKPPISTPQKKAKHDLRAVGLNFEIPGEFVSATPYGSGHINDTYAATYIFQDREHRYIHQRINHSIFKDPVALMENVARVTSHQQSKLAAAGVPDAERRSLTTIGSREGLSYYKDENGDTWRTYTFIEGATTHDSIQSPLQATQAAKAFGEFQEMLTDLPGGRLHDTIPDFHDTPKRLQALVAAIASDPQNRAVNAAAEINFILKREHLASVLLGKHAAGLIPERITHNDTKLNNVMLDDVTSEAVCVIDLDTVMPGLVLYDFGDMVRTATSPRPEDERNLSLIHMQMPMFEALLDGYLTSAHHFLTATERDCLAFSGKLITLEIGIRFLTDFLLGDIYFKTKRQDHNLERCRTQLKLVASIEEQEAEMNEIVHAWTPKD